MRLLLDTHLLLWWLGWPERVPMAARQAVAAAEHVHVSHASLWELEQHFKIHGQVRAPRNSSQAWFEPTAVLVKNWRYAKRWLALRERSQYAAPGT